MNSSKPALSSPKMRKKNTRKDFSLRMLHFDFV